MTFFLAFLVASLVCGLFCYQVPLRKLALLFAVAAAFMAFGYFFLNRI
jgi:hypothetical protein